MGDNMRFSPDRIDARLGETVRFRVHNAGKLICQTQSPQRDCNERSLLRRHGPGMKFVTVVTTETIAPVCKAAVSTSAMLLDGGVGQ